MTPDADGAAAAVVMVLVHPGSACGSLDFHHGGQMANEERRILAQRLRTWNGPLIVVDSDLSDEIAARPDLHDAIEGALDRGRAQGHHVARVPCMDEDEDWVRPSADAVLLSGVTSAIVTGAWYHPEDDGGCVNAVYDELRSRGMAVDVDDSAISIDVG